MLIRLNPYCSGRWSRTMFGQDVFTPQTRCLNPYCSGRWSRTLKLLKMHFVLLSLNPYCSGQWSRTDKKYIVSKGTK